MVHLGRIRYNINKDRLALVKRCMVRLDQVMVSLGKIKNIVMQGKVSFVKAKYS